jgi:hypothetical protein
MAEVDYVAVASGTIGAIWVFVQILIGLGIAGLILWALWLVFAYKHSFRVRELTGDKTRVIDDKAREVKDKSGVLKWRLRRRRHFVPVPPPEAIHLTKRGKYSVEAYFTPNGEYKYIEDRGIDETTLKGFTPLTTEDREFYVNEMVLAESYKKKNVLDIIREFAPLMALMLIFILMLVFWEDIAQPSIELTKANAGTAESLRETTVALRDIVQDRQTVTDDGGG